MRRVSPIMEEQRLRVRQPSLNRSHVSQSPVLIVFALNHQRGASYRTKIFFDVPFAKSRIEPDVIPSAKHFINMIVISRKPFRQVARFIEFANRRDASQAELFDE